MKSKRWTGYKIRVDDPNWKEPKEKWYYLRLRFILDNIPWYETFAVYEVRNSEKKYLRVIGTRIFPKHPISFPEDESDARDDYEFRAFYDPAIHFNSGGLCNMKLTYPWGEDIEEKYHGMHAIYILLPLRKRLFLYLISKSMYHHFRPEYLSVILSIIALIWSIGYSIYSYSYMDDLRNLENRLSNTKDTLQREIQELEAASKTTEKEVLKGQNSLDKLQMNLNSLEEKQKEQKEQLSGKAAKHHKHNQ